MSKAFTLEDAPQGASRCPDCGRPGVRVEPGTVGALVPAEERAELGSDVSFCATPGCPVGYLDALGRTVAAAALPVLGYPKRTDADAVVCYCFGVRLGEVSAERLSEIRARLDRAEGRCDRVSPTGRRCVPEVVRLLRAARR
jgi:hypothetical protein